MKQPNIRATIGRSLILIRAILKTDDLFKKYVKMLGLTVPQALRYIALAEQDKTNGGTER